MTHALMTRNRFQTLAEAFGGDLRHWPAAEREAAGRLLVAEPSLQSNLDQASALDDALRAWASPAVGFDLRSRVLAAAPTAMRRGRALVRWIFGAGVGAGLAAACTAGLITGAALTPQFTNRDAAIQIAGDAFESLDGGDFL